MPYSRDGHFPRRPVLFSFHQFLSSLNYKNLKPMKTKFRLKFTASRLSTAISENTIEMKVASTIFVLPLLCVLIIAASTRCARATLIQPSDPSGTVINTNYTGLGVTFSDPVPGSDGNIYANNGCFYTISGGAVVFPSMIANSGAVEATFSTPQTSVSINTTPVGLFEFLGTNPENDPFLEAFSGPNATGTFLGQVVLPFADMPNIVQGFGPTNTLTFTSGSANIGSVIFSEQPATGGQGYTGEFRVLSFNNNLTGNNPTGVYTPVEPTPLFRKPIILPGRIFQGSFDYFPRADVRVLLTTDASLPSTSWTVLGSGVTELSPGQYQFDDSQAINSPYRFYRLLTQAGTYVGNTLTVTNSGSDGAPPLVVLGEYSPSGPLATSAINLPAGSVEDVKFYGNNYNFTLYALSYVSTGSNPNEQKFKVVASEHFSGSASTGIQTLPVSGFSVSAGLFLAFAGTGPYYSQNADDGLNSDAPYENSSNPGSDTATPPGGSGTIFTVGTYPDASANYEYIPNNFGNQGRNYAIGIDVSP